MYEKEIQLQAAIQNDPLASEDMRAAACAAIDLMRAACVNPQDEREHCTRIARDVDMTNLRDKWQIVQEARAAVRAPLQLQLEAARAAHGQAEVELAKVRAELAHAHERIERKQTGAEEYRAEIERLKRDLAGERRSINTLKLLRNGGRLED